MICCFCKYPLTKHPVADAKRVPDSYGCDVACSSCGAILTITVTVRRQPTVSPKRLAEIVNRPT